MATLREGQVRGNERRRKLAGPRPESRAETLLASLRRQTWSVNHYRILGLDDFEEDVKAIRTAYRQLALAYHPDKMGRRDQQEVSTTLFKMINEAHALLSNREEKAKYDFETSSRRTRQQAYSCDDPDMASYAYGAYGYGFAREFAGRGRGSSFHRHRQAAGYGSSAYGTVLE